MTTVRVSNSGITVQVATVAPAASFGPSIASGVSTVRATAGRIHVIPAGTLEENSEIRLSRDGARHGVSQVRIVREDDSLFTVSVFDAGNLSDPIAILDAGARSSIELVYVGVGDATGWFQVGFGGLG